MTTQVLIHRPNIDDHMHELALKAQAFEEANPEESNEFESTLMDGLDPNETFDAEKLFALRQK